MINKKKKSLEGLWLNPQEGFQGHYFSNISIYLKRYMEYIYFFFLQDRILLGKRRTNELVGLFLCLLHTTEPTSNDK